VSTRPCADVSVCLCVSVRPCTHAFTHAIIGLVVFVLACVYPHHSMCLNVSFMFVHEHAGKHMHASKATHLLCVHASAYPQGLVPGADCSCN